MAPAELRNPLQPLLGYQLRRASATQMGHLAEHLAPTGLTPTEASVLVLIDANPGITPTALGRMLGMHSANMTPLSALLDRRGLTTRRRVNGRSHGLAVTDAGATLAGNVLAAMQRHEAAIRQRLNERAYEPLARTMARLWRDPASG